MLKLNKKVADGIRQNVNDPNFNVTFSEFKKEITKVPIHKRCTLIFACGLTYPK